MNVINPTSAHIPALRRLWKLAFGDEDAFLDLFFAHAFSPDRCRCIMEGDSLAAAHYWFDTECRGQKFAYLYAVATDPDYRGRGLCRALTEDLIRILPQQGYHGIILVPQNESVIAMYRKLGYVDCTQMTEISIPGADLGLSLQQITADRYAALRRGLLPPGSIIQDGQNLPFLSSLYAFFSFGSSIAAVHLEKGVLHCQEILPNSDAAAGLVHALGCTLGKFRIPGSGRLFTQYMPLCPDCVKPTYFAFAYD